MDRLLSAFARVKAGQIILACLVVIIAGLTVAIGLTTTLYNRAERAQVARYKATLEVTQKIDAQSTRLTREFNKLKAGQVIAESERRECLAILRVLGNKVGVSAQEIRDARRAVDLEVED